jgi:hypothetical protein
MLTALLTYNELAAAATSAAELHALLLVGAQAV